MENNQEYLQNNPDMGYKLNIKPDQENRDPVLIHIHQSLNQLTETYGDKAQYKPLLKELKNQANIIDVSLEKEVPDDVSDNVDRAIKLIDEIKDLDNPKNEVQ